MACGLAYMVDIMFCALDLRFQYAHAILHTFAFAGSACHSHCGTRLRRITPCRARDGQ
jgi:hypothetical protein